MNGDDPFQAFRIPVDRWTETAVQWLAAHWRPVFQTIRVPLAEALDRFGDFLTSAHPAIVLAALFLVAWQVRGLRAGFVCTFTMLVIGVIGVWVAAMKTLALIAVAVVVCVLIGFPTGVLAARSDRFDRLLRPVLDTVQTLPAFVYLVPVVLLVGIGDLPGIIVTVIFAVAPVVRLTSLGLRGVPPAVLEAATALGSSPRQVLLKVQLPLAVPTILLGINQTIMMALAMVTYSSMIGVDGLGQLVLRGIGRLDMGLATVGGIGIVVLAMILSELMLPGKAGPARRRSGGHTPLSLVILGWRALQRLSQPDATPRRPRHGVTADRRPAVR